MHEGLWKKIVQVHGHAKALTLRAEELDPKQEIFFPSVIQQRDGHDHVMRAKAAILGLKAFEDEASKQNYEASNLDKALGHEYRAFFDIADWLAILYREKINGALCRYSPESIDAVLPSYYSEIVPKVEKLHREIAAIRNRKDIGSGDGVLEQVEEYRKLLDGLDEDWCQIIDSKAALEHRRRGEKRKGVKSVLLKLVIGVLIAAASGFIGWALK